MSTYICIGHLKFFNILIQKYCEIFVASELLLPRTNIVPSFSFFWLKGNRIKAKPLIQDWNYYDNALSTQTQKCLGTKALAQKQEES